MGHQLWENGYDYSVADNKTLIRSAGCPPTIAGASDFCVLHELRRCKIFKKKAGCIELCIVILHMVTRDKQWQIVDELINIYYIYIYIYNVFLSFLVIDWL